MSAPLRDERNRRWDKPFGEKPLDAQTVARILGLPAFERVDPAGFPDHLQLDDIIAYEGRVRSFQHGDIVLRKGDYGNSLFVILSGGVTGINSPSNGQDSSVSQRRQGSWGRSLMQLFARHRPPEFRAPRFKGSAGKSLPAAKRQSTRREFDGVQTVDVDEITKHQSTFTLHAPQMFGELAALTRSPRSATVFASENGTLLFELSWQGLREIRDWSDVFRQQIDALYHQRGLASRLRTCPVFNHIEDDVLDLIAREALFETYGSFTWTHRFKRELGKKGRGESVIGLESVICAQGDHVDGLLLINNGFARVSERVDQGERTIGYLSTDEVHGLDEIRDARDSAQLTLRTSLRAIGYVDAIRIPTHLVREHVLPGLKAEPKPLSSPALAAAGKDEISQGMMDFLVDHRFINGEQAMVINLDRCVGCDDCVRACASAHDNNPRFFRSGPAYKNAMVAHACMHCTDPVCLIGCPTGAIHRSTDGGTVVINDDTCIGCATCANSCPYNNIKMVEIRDENGDFQRDREGKPIARATKCDFCNSQLNGPACVQACPHDALIRTKIRDTRKLRAWLA